MQALVPKLIEKDLFRPLHQSEMLERKDSYAMRIETFNLTKLLDQTVLLPESVLK